MRIPVACSMLVVVAITTLVGYGHAQIPGACTDQASLRDLTCCPTTSNGVCGVDTGRGECVNLNPPNHSNSTTDVRNNWPHYYIRACQCNGNFDGYDCSSCKFGYYGPECGEYQTLSRESAADWSDTDWTRFNNALRMSRTFDSGYVAVLEETYPGNTSLNTADLTIYGMFIWMHHYAAKDSLDPIMPVDYAHIGPAFNTWHRFLGLWLERAIQEMLKSMNDPDYHLFRLPYWDWRQEIQKLPGGLGADELFTANRIGATRNVSGRAVVTGDLYGDDGWETMCWHRIGQICDPQESTGLLQRCPFTGANPCSTDNPDWPVTADVLLALAIGNYDVSPYNIQSIGGYRSFVDFLIGVASFEACRNDRLCLCTPSMDPMCANETNQFTLLSGMHFLGHIIIGRGDFNFLLNNDISEIGTFEDFAGSPNDPVFILHHNMLDCILVEWLRRHPGTEYPSGVTNPGHARDGFIVPFFPLYTNVELFVPPEELGYTCNLPGLSESAAMTSMSVTWVLLLGLLAIAYIQH